jgi:tRNA(fMet)-specific endonuclease VapC
VLYLLDTNILSDLERNPSGSVAMRLAQVESVEDTAIATSVVVACEARFGIRKRGSNILEQRVEKILAKIHVLPLDAGIATRMPKCAWNWSARENLLEPTTC